MPKTFKNKSDESKYNSIHAWVVRHFGKASKCEKCENPNGYRCEWANISGEYKRERSDFMQLCQSCHKKHDHGNTCKRGHEYTEQNTLIRKDGNRQCKQCMYMATRKYKQKIKLKKHEVG